MNNMRRIVVVVVVVCLFLGVFRLGFWRLLGDIIVRLNALRTLEMNLKEFFTYGSTWFPWWTFRSIFVR